MSISLGGHVASEMGPADGLPGGSCTRREVAGHFAVPGTPHGYHCPLLIIVQVVSQQLKLPQDSILLLTLSLQLADPLSG